VNGSARPPILSARGLSKTFGGRVVLRDVDLDVLPGEIHGLVGQNGSGKSTLIKILAGVYAPDPGASLSVSGTPIPLPLDPRRGDVLGLSFVHQDLGLVPEMTVLENLRVGHYATGFGWRIRWQSEREAVRAALDRFGLAHISPDAPVSTLRAVERATIAIVRAFERLQNHPSGLLVLDEPTVYLPRDGVDRLFAAVRTVSTHGVGVLFVSHRLDEVRGVTDRVTVLRDGARVDTAPTSSLGEQDLLERILGRALGELYPGQHDIQGQVLLRVDDLRADGLSPFGLELRRGEIVGITGLLGMGQERIPYLLFGAERARHGSLQVSSRMQDVRTLSPRRAIDLGLALLPADRLRDGAAQGATVLENVTLPGLGGYFRNGLLRHRQERRRVSDRLAAFQVTPREPERIFMQLSGGNQQKSLLIKWFETQPLVMLLHEPTQGVDIGARKQIFERIRDFAQSGGAVLISSVEYADLANLCDRVIVFRDGRVVSEVRSPALSEDVIVAHCYMGASTALT
jgi:ribose transport system ATP-binding protein